ncbi:MAG: phosphatase PAP2 family protein [Mucilaginibacter polytrichastri]|nr:phosphatase PAP2 family protein [Mucilaginibacter polytrichastri]
MLEHILELDRRLFYFINHDLANPVFDVLMPVFRNKFTWIPLYVLIAWQLIRQFKRAGVLAIVLLALCFGAADQISAGIIKKQVQRVRPCNQPAMEAYVTERVDCGTGLSFPSSHATNHFAVAVFISIVFYQLWKPVLWISLAWASLICFAQVYVGVHFPVDVLTGAVLGSLIGAFFAWIFKRTAPLLS